MGQNGSVSEDDENQTKPDPAQEDTRPLWHPSYQQEQPQAPHQHQYTRAYPVNQGYGYGPPVYAQRYPQPPSTTKVPGWLWPVVAATALVVGLVGGTLGGVAVSSSMNDGS